MSRRLARMSPQAADWLKAEITHIADRNPAAARNVAARIRLARQNLAEYPKIGPVGLVPGTRRLVVSPYVLTVRQRGGVLEIAAIRHSRQSDAYQPRDMVDEVHADGPVVDPLSGDPFRFR